MLVEIWGRQAEMLHQQAKTAKQEVKVTKWEIAVEWELLNFCIVPTDQSAYCYSDLNSIF